MARRIAHGAGARGEAAGRLVAATVQIQKPAPSLLGKFMLSSSSSAGIYLRGLDTFQQFTPFPRHFYNGQHTSFAPTVQSRPTLLRSDQCGTTASLSAHRPYAPNLPSLPAVWATVQAIVLLASALPACHALFESLVRPVPAGLSCFELPGPSVT